ncbi:N-acetylglucosamine-1-phosphotransferase subunit gamma-like [Acanthaster planci]|uniref:N-acetylglucosamine-1-phosphotransferase subunit gamma-like n=1 Tax=Acanthaster planci TaxID=133434 RepID=A0A8B7YSV8_ACAPL|nr:N-acetylglucosamine-1-phosphotransferase subunit gamma-like [Acanthaster planci]
MLLFAILPVLLICDVSVISARQVKMRMVNEPINTGQTWGNNEPEILKPKVKPANFSGPPHLKRLVGRCFSKTVNSYKYELCPFQNVTQHEQSLRWNPYSGILGIWQEWQIEGNVFKSMLMTEGDQCLDKSRKVTVHLECGALNSITNVSEPTTCEYAIVFVTPLVCHPHSLLVYPTLSEALRSRWDEIEGELFNEEITLQGYQKKLTQIFQDAGYVLDPSKREQLKAATKSDQLLAPQGDGFETLEACSAAYAVLEEEIRRLKAQLERQGQGQGQDPEENPLFNLDNIYT